MRKTIEQEILLILLEKEGMSQEYIEKLDVHLATKQNKGMLISDIIKVSGCSYPTGLKILHKGVTDKIFDTYFPEGRKWKLYILTPEGKKIAMYLKKVFGGFVK